MVQTHSAAHDSELKDHVILKFSKSNTRHYLGKRTKKSTAR